MKIVLPMPPNFLFQKWCARTLRMGYSLMLSDVLRVLLREKEEICVSENAFLRRRMRLIQVVKARACAFAKSLCMQPDVASS